VRGLPTLSEEWSAQPGETVGELPPLQPMSMPGLANGASGGSIDGDSDSLTGLPEPLPPDSAALTAPRTVMDGTGPDTSGMIHKGSCGTLLSEWLPLSQAPGYVGAKARTTSVSSNDDEFSQDHSSIGGHPSVNNDHRDSIGSEPVWLAQSLMESSAGGGSPQEEYAQLQAMAQHQSASVASAEATRAAATAAAQQVAVCAQAAEAMANADSPADTPMVACDAIDSANSLAPSGVGWQAPSMASGAHCPRLLDSSCREGSFGGGTPVWLHGENFSHDLHVRFGGAAAAAVNVISHNLIKCMAPSFQPFSTQARHEVAITLVVASTNAPVPGTIPFAYVQGGLGGVSNSAYAEGATRVPPELLHRLLHSLERAQSAAAAAVASSADASFESSSLDTSISAELGLSAFAAMDEHGFSLAEYAGELKHSLTDVQDGHLPTGDASELQLQLGDLATVLKRERLSASLAKRPSVELLRQHNILPDPEQTSQRRQTLLHSLANRPGLETLQQRHILHSADEKQEQLAKRKRLEGFLAERPTPEQVQPVVGELPMAMTAHDVVSMLAEVPSIAHT